MVSLSLHLWMKRFFHVTANDRISSISVVEECSILDIYFSFFIPSSRDNKFNHVAPDDMILVYGMAEDRRFLKYFFPFLHMSTHNCCNDLDETMPTTLQVFSNILQHCGLQGDGASSTPQKLEERGRLTPNDMPLLELKDIVLHLCDTCTTLWAFLGIFPLACQTFQKHNFRHRLASFYEAAIPEMESAIKKRKLEDSKLLGDLWQRLSHSRKKLMEIFHIILNQICLLPILEGSCDNTQGFIEEFLQTFSSLLQEKRFLWDYDTLFPVAEDISLLQQTSSVLDKTWTAYILQAVESAWEGVDRWKATDAKDPSVTEEPNGVTVMADAVSQASSHPENSEEEECMGAAAAVGLIMCGVELDSLISQVKDLLPDLGEGFILACLEYYHYDTEQVINNILEEQMAPTLTQLDHNLGREMKPDQTPLLTSHHNVFHNDEFDMFSRDAVDLRWVHKGKSTGKEENTRSFLNDKHTVCHEQYSVVVEEVLLQPGESLPYHNVYYEDEDDDTYDGNQVDTNDADADDKLISRRPFTIPQGLRTKVPREGQEEEEGDDEEEEAPKPDHFMQDPAVLREKAEARRIASLAKKGYRHDSSTAVAGSPRGHGQSHETT
uniref:CUE domain-containing protein n=1 Tax=Cebus imitator TaxID=2715852 RepID=A0A2K5R314_CEBIM